MPVSGSDRTHNSVAQHSLVDRRECKNWPRRNRLEDDPQKWLKWYLHGAYTRKFEKAHIAIIKGVVKAHSDNTKFCVAAERGIGKSAILWGMVLYLALTGRRKFPICVPWAAVALKRAFKFWKNALCYNARLDDDYPEFTAPFVHSKGIAQKIMHAKWRDTEDLTGAQLTISEGMIVLPDGLAVLGGGTINGNIRGLNHPQADGAVIRPDIALLDDIQDRQVAKSPAQVLDTIAIIDGDVGGCGEVGRDMPMLMACNCITKDDVSAYYLDHDEWTALRVPCVETWPDGWDDKNSAVRESWDELHDKILADSGAVSFYRKNKKAITKGMKLSAPSVFKGAKKCPDAFYGVIRMYFRLGHESFMAERQQQPIDPIAQAGPYTLTPSVILSRETKRKQFEKPDWVTSVMASTDINPSYALSTVVLGFGQDQTACVLWYGLHKLSIPGNTSAPELARQLFEQLTIHGRALAAMPVHPQFWGIDGGGAQFDAVGRFSDQSAILTGIPSLAFTGRGARNYRQYGKTMVPAQRREQCHGCIDRKQGRVIRWVAWNADYWKEMAQRAWLGDIGAPGAVTLYEGKHAELANQICGDKLLGKGEVGGQMIWNFTRVPGRNDFGDAMAQCYAVSAFQGIGTGGSVVRRKQKHKRRLQHVKV